MNVDLQIEEAFKASMPNKEIKVLHLGDDIHVWVDWTLWIHEDISDDDGLFRFYRHSPGVPVTLTFPYPG